MHTPAHPSEIQRTIEGQIVMGDFQTVPYRCVVRLSDGKSIVCFFDEPQRDAVLAGMCRDVRISGTSVARRGKTPALHIATVELLPGSARCIFDPTPHLEQLAAEQGLES